MTSRKTIFIFTRCSKLSDPFVKLWYNPYFVIRLQRQILVNLVNFEITHYCRIPDSHKITHYCRILDSHKITHYCRIPDSHKISCAERTGDKYTYTNMTFVRKGSETFILPTEFLTGLCRKDPRQIYFRPVGQNIYTFPLDELYRW